MDKKQMTKKQIAEMMKAIKLTKEVARFNAMELNCKRRLFK